MPARLAVMTDRDVTVSGDSEGIRVALGRDRTSTDMAGDLSLPAAGYVTMTPVSGLLDQ
ncbi:MAG: hypothetical protein ACJ72W_25155 [Actinoallomurus sp.]